MILRRHIRYDPPRRLRFDVADPRVIPCRNFDDPRQVRRGEEADRRPERRPKSMRNYRRTLRIAEACYLDARHPRLLISMLNSPSANMLSMGVRRDAFRGLVRVATSPLGCLLDGDIPSSHANRIRKNVRGILERGCSLPLVFPRYELGFSYGPGNDYIDRTFANGEEGSDDALGYAPRLRTGHRMPHVLLEANGGIYGLDAAKTRRNSSDDAYFSLTEISPVLRDVNSTPSPLFTLLAVGPTFDVILPRIDEVVSGVTEAWNVPIVLVRVLPGKRHDAVCSNVVSVIDARCALSELLRRERALSGDNMEHSNRDFEYEEAVNALIMIRPDGHIANVAWIHERENVEIESIRIRGAIEQGLEDALGIRALKGYR